MGQPDTLYFEIYRDGTLVRTDACGEAAIKIGSHAKSHVCVDDPDVGRAHAMVEKTDAGVFVIDLGSGRGTLVNGERVNKRALQHRDRIGLGTTELVVLFFDEKAAARTAALERAAVDPATNRPKDEVLYARRFLSRPAATDGSVEIAMLYNDHVMAEELYKPPVDIVIGPSDAARYKVEHTSLASDHVLISGGGTPMLHLLRGMEAEIYVGSERRQVTADDAGGAFPLTDETRAKIVVGDVKFFVHRSTRPTVVLPWERREATPMLFLLFSALLHGILLGLILFLPPGVGSLALDSFGSRDRFVNILIQDPEPEPEEVPEEEEEAAEEEGQQRAEDEEGRAGQEQAPDEENQMALAGDLPPGEIELARSQAVETVQNRGALAVLNQTSPAALFGTGPSGDSALMAIGAMDGDSVGASYGSYGLGSYGGGIGGGGRFTGGPLSAGPMSLRSGRSASDRVNSTSLARVGRESRVPTVGIGSDVRIEGQLDREIIARVIREHRREVRACYEAELIGNAELEGRVVVSFVIAADGQVAGSRVTETTLNNSNVESCIANRVRRWRFPEPRGGGTVNVNYPFVLTLGG